MEAILKKYFWTTTVVTVVCCAILSAKAANHLLEKKVFADDETPVLKNAAPKVSTARTGPVISKNGEPLRSRNMFCSDCAPPPPPPPDPNEQDAKAPEVDPNQAFPTSLPLELLATHISRSERNSFATVINTQTQRQGSYWVGDAIPDAGPVLSISYNYVDYHHQGSNRRERIHILGKNKVKATEPPRPKPPRPRPGNKDNDEISSQINKVDDTHFEVERALVDKMLANPLMASKGARIVPSVQKGKPDGFKLYAIRPSSIYAKLGIKNGDTIQVINGFELTTADKALEVYTKVREATNLSVQVKRRGKPLTLNYTIR